MAKNDSSNIQLDCERAWKTMDSRGMDLSSSCWHHKSFAVKGFTFQALK